METFLKGRIKKTKNKKLKNIFNIYKKRKINNKLFTNMFGGNISYIYKKPLKIFIIFILLVISYFMLKKLKNKIILPNFGNNNININNKKKSNTTIAMCAIAKMENRYIKYFVDYYLKLGYDHIYLYDNNVQAPKK